MAGVTVLGAAAGTGKTGVSIGLLRCLSAAGVPAVPCKAVAVVDQSDPALVPLPPWQRGVFHNCAAAGVDVAWWHNPVTVIRHPGDDSGDLYLCGEAAGTVPVGGEDTLDAARLSDRVRRRCRDAVHAALDQVRAAGRWTVLEGAGGAADLDPADDLANSLAPARAGLPVVVVANASRSGHLAALAGTVRLLDRRLAPLLRGYVLNQVRDLAATDRLTQRLDRATGLDHLATLPEAKLPPGYDGSPELLEALYNRRARHVRDSGLLGVLGPPLPAEPALASQPTLLP